MSPARVLLLQQSDCLGVVLNARDAYTQQHCSRVEGVSLEIGRRCGLSEDQLELLRISARLHDIGKIGIPDRILLKPGRFEPDEWAVMKTHAALGQAFCNALPHDDGEAVGRIVRHHHEFFDGQGYPDGLSGEDIPIASRIITITDSYDAMTTMRPYHEPRSHEQVMQILSDESGIKLDPYVFQHFASVISQREYSSLM